jgi:hypothetical protein
VSAGCDARRSSGRGSDARNSIHREEGKFEDSAGLCEDPAMEAENVNRQRKMRRGKTPHCAPKTKKSSHKNGIKKSHENDMG